MKIFLHLFSATLLLFFAHMSYAVDAPRIGIINITQLFTDSSYVKGVNEKLQADVKSMETKVQAQQKNLQELMSQYDSANSSQKKNLKDKISSEQAKLMQMTQEYQQKIRGEQNSGMQKFSDQVRVAVEKVAKKQNLNAVLSNAAVVYSDSSWVDITKDVANELK